MGCIMNGKMKFIYFLRPRRVTGEMKPPMPPIDERRGGGVEQIARERRTDDYVESTKQLATPRRRLSVL